MKFKIKDEFGKCVSTEQIADIAKEVSDNNDNNILEFTDDEIKALKSLAAIAGDIQALLGNKVKEEADKADKEAENNDPASDLGIDSEADEIEEDLEEEDDTIEDSDEELDIETEENDNQIQREELVDTDDSCKTDACEDACEDSCDDVVLNDSKKSFGAIETKTMVDDSIDSDDEIIQYWAKRYK